MKHAIHYTIIAKDLAAHLFAVSVVVDKPDPDGQIFRLPAWTPGSYMMREFAKNIVQATASCNGKKVKLIKLDKHSWRAAKCDGPLSVQYDVYAWDLSVRAAHLDQTHGFFNGSSVFLSVNGREDSVHLVDIQKPLDEGCQAWRVATAMRQLKAKRYGFGTYIASNYDELIDHPVEMGTFTLATFKAHGVPHDIVFTGRVPNLDLPRITADLKKICETEIAFFEPKSKQAPMDRYVFMTMVVSNDYGGLEHRASTSLICARADLPVKGKAEISDGYRTFLGLCSHEYFHTWNVKRIKPAAFVPYDLTTEAYTPLLWLFEGFTSYYDDLMLLRSGVISAASYLSLVAKANNNVLRGGGRHKQSVAESSFDAWIKYYRQDENSANAVVSYYTKGSLVALALDLTIRAETKGKKSLDDVMRALWRQYGREFYQDGKAGIGVTDADVDALFDEVTGLKLKRLLDTWARGTTELPLSTLLPTFGIRYNDQRAATRPVLGIRTVREGLDCRVSSVYEKSAAHKAGIAAGDVLVAIDGVRVSVTMDNLFGRYCVGDTIEIHAFRRDELRVFKAKLVADDTPMVILTTEEKPSIAARQLRKGWLGNI